MKGILSQPFENNMTGGGMYKPKKDKFGYLHMVWELEAQGGHHGTKTRYLEVQATG
jgi:hypothetical protein